MEGKAIEPNTGLALTELTESQRQPNLLIAGEGPAIPEERLYKLVDVLDAISKETGKTAAQVSINWLLQRPTVASVLIGARDEEQLRENLGSVGWNLSEEQVARLDEASETDTIYPYWHQRGFTERNPFPTKLYK